MNLPTSNRVELTLTELYPLCTSRLRDIFSQYVSTVPSTELKEAIEYNLLNHGKLLRPFLIYTAGLLFDAPLANLDIPACAVEMVHTYSLIHDDLPCMDNADFRRGKATSHKLFGEGIAVLTGDAIHTLAIQILAEHPAKLIPEKRLMMIKTLATACGPYGMAAGQALDITLMQKKSISGNTLIDIYRLKTGALFTACLELGRLASDDDHPEHKSALKLFGDCVGLAFQIQDDLLDIESTSSKLGKPQGNDAQQQKITYPQISGLIEAKAKVTTLYKQALAAIECFGYKAQLLRDLTALLLNRER